MDGDKENLLRLLSGLAEVLIGQEVSYHDLIPILQKAYVKAAEDNFAIEGRKMTASRISLLTGINRKDVQRIRTEEGAIGKRVHGQNRAVAVVTGWGRDERFRDRELSFEGENSFSELVRYYSGDVPPRAVKDELIRLGAVEINEQGNLVLVRPVLIPDNDQQAKISLIFEAMKDLLGTGRHNLDNTGTDSRLQLSLAYGGLGAETLHNFKQLSQTGALELLRDLDASLNTAKQEQALDPDAKTFRGGLGIYYFEEHDAD